MLKFLKVSLGLVLATIFGSLSFVLFEKSQTLLALFFIGISLLSFFIWSSKKTLTYRFLYPGMMAFTLFTILPIIFSVFISFTNLGTGHFFSQQEVKNILLSEKVLLGSGTTLPFKVYPEGIIEVDTPSAVYQGKTSDINSGVLYLKPAETSYNSPLPLVDVYNRKDVLKKVIFRLPNGKDYLYHRVDQLIEGSFLYSELENGGVQNTKTQKVYRPSSEHGAFVSTQNDHYLEPGFYTYVGFKNFRDLFGKKEFRHTFLKVSTWTFLWALISVALTFSLGMSLALFLNDKNLRFKAVYRNLFILPYSIPFFISVLVFKGMLNKDFGVINDVLTSVGLNAIPWLEDGLWAKVSCLLVNLWLGFPYMFLLTTGILQSIPESVYEAAKIDGATKWQSFKSITLPLILNSITPLLIGAFAFNLGNFVGIYLLTGGGPAMAEATTPAGETDILISYTYRLAFEGAMGQQFGLASSIALFIFVIIGALTALNFKVFNKGQEL